MRVLVAGASGALGRRLVPILAGAGHEVLALVRPGSPRGREFVRRTGTRAIHADLLDPARVEREVRTAAPEAVVHLSTSIPARIDPRHLAGQFALTNRLRTEGTRALLGAAADAGATRLITESLAYVYEPSGTGLADEDDPWWIKPPRQFAPVLAALEELERLTGEAGGLALRLGHLYGPGTSYAPDGSFVQQIRGGKLPIVGAGSATFSFTHVDDVASAIVAALDRDATGVLNLVDDDPAQLREWLPELARFVGAPAPKHVPPALARLAVGGWGVAFMTQLRGADNARARLQLDWRPRYSSWRDGFAAELDQTAASAG